jgi:hypothetical protein
MGVFLMLAVYSYGSAEFNDSFFLSTFAGK